MSSSSAKPIVLHIGDPIKYNPQTYALLAQHFTVVRPGAEERERGAFMRALRERRWGDFSAIFRPFWGTGGEMGQWDAELISLLPPSVRVFASAGAGFDWADTVTLGKRGEIYPRPRGPNSVFFLLPHPLLLSPLRREGKGTRSGERVTKKEKRKKKKPEC